MTKAVMKKGWTFILAAPSSDFEFTDLVRSFTNAAHLSTVEANFIVLDTFIEHIQPSEFGLTQFPAQIFVDSDNICGFQYRGFDEELTQAFINTHAVSSIPTITTKSDLDKLYSLTACALLISVDGASSATLPNIATFYHNHFNEISIAFVSPSIIPPGWYVYRYNDGTLTEVPDLSTKSQSEIAHVLLQNSVPEFMKFNSYVAELYESRHQLYAVLMLAMEDFYLTPEQLELARSLQAEGINVSYSDLENNQILALRHGIPDSLDSTLCVIDARGNRTFKYMLPDELNVENAVKFIKDCKAGNAKKFWKSESDVAKPKDHIITVTANTLEKMTTGDKALVLCLYFASTEQIEPFVDATKVLKENYEKVADFGKFSLMLNDWSIDDLVFDDLPYIAVYKAGKVIYQEVMDESASKVMSKLTPVLAQLEREL